MGYTASSKCCCHALGVTLTLLSGVCLVGGFVLLLVYSSDFDDVDAWSLPYALGIGAIAAGTLTSVMTVVYLCATFRRGWRIFGCLKIKAPRKTLSQSLTQLPSKDQLNQSPGPNQGSESAVSPPHDRTTAGDNKRVTAYDMQQQQTERAETEWDPETVLKDDDMY